MRKKSIRKRLGFPDGSLVVRASILEYAGLAKRYRPRWTSTQFPQHRQYTSTYRSVLREIFKNKFSHVPFFGIFTGLLLHACPAFPACSVRWSILLSAAQVHVKRPKDLQVQLELCCRWL